MRLIVAQDYNAMSRRAAQMVAKLVRAKPEAAVMVPTGDTPRGFYAELAAIHRRDEFDVSRLRVFQLDEYLGVGARDPNSFQTWITRAFLDPLGIAASRLVRLPGDADDAAAACRAYDERMRSAGGCDIAVLGLGWNGHLGFNEPPADPASPTRVVALSAETVASNGRYWGASATVPNQALTCGMANILAARHKLVLVSGERKREILRRVVTGPVSPETPATYLKASDQVTVLADAAAWPWPVPEQDKVAADRV